MLKLCPYCSGDTANSSSGRCPHCGRDLVANREAINKAVENLSEGLSKMMRDRNKQLTQGGVIMDQLSVEAENQRLREVNARLNQDRKRLLDLIKKLKRNDLSAEDKERLLNGFSIDSIQI